MAYLILELCARQPWQKFEPSTRLRPLPKEAICWPWVAKEGILVAEQILTWQLKWSGDLQTLHFDPYGARRVVGGIQSDQSALSYQALAPIWLSWSYSSNCSCGKQVPNPILSQRRLKVIAEGQLHWDYNTWNHLTVYKQMSSKSFKINVTYKPVHLQILYIYIYIHIYIYIYIW